MEEDNSPPGDEENSPTGCSDRQIEEAGAEHDASAKNNTTIASSSAIDVSINNHQGTFDSPPIHTPSKPLLKASITPDGRKYRLLHDKMKVRYRELQDKYQKSEEARVKLDEQLTKIASENETMRQKLESKTSRALMIEGNTSSNPEKNSITIPLCN